MTLRTQDQDTVSLYPKILVMKQTLDMNLFLITNYSLIYKNTTMDSQMISMQIVLKRKVMSEMMTTYFPSALLMLITFATTFFKPFFFEAALSVNLTTMLVMTTIFISKMESLPPTSATKMIDYFLILCQLVPFAEVVLLTAIEYQREDKDENGEPDDVKGTELEAHGLPQAEEEHDAEEPAPEVCMEAWKAPKNENVCLDLKMIGIFIDL